MYIFLSLSNAIDFILPDITQLLPESMQLMEQAVATHPTVFKESLLSQAHHQPVSLKQYLLVLPRTLLVQKEELTVLCLT